MANHSQVWPVTISAPRWLFTDLTTFLSGGEIAVNNGLGDVGGLVTGQGQKAFVGVWSDQPFDRIAIRETFGTDDNEFYGEFFTGATAPVPEPGAGGLGARG